LIDHQALVEFVAQPASVDTTSEMEVTAKDGQTYTAELSLIKGGGRSCSYGQRLKNFLLPKAKSPISEIGLFLF
jgi:hypothetical protein